MTSNLMTDLIEKWHENKRPTYRFTLCLGDWRRQVPEEVRNLIFASAVNFCIEAKILEVVGYMMSTTKIRVILDRKNSELQHGLELFSSLVEEALTQYHHQQRGLLSQHEKLSPAYTKSNLFRVTAFDNFRLARLITGRPVNPPYEDPYVQRLKRYVNHSDYSSAVDYSGEIGPVNVVVKPPKYFNN
ncbi:MAG: hypothetical protein ABJM06_07805 [Gilvibacter sp.]